MPYVYACDCPDCAPSWPSYRPRRTVVCQNIQINYNYGSSNDASGQASTRERSPPRASSRYSGSDTDILTSDPLRQLEDRDRGSSRSTMYSGSPLPSAPRTPPPPPPYSSRQRSESRGPSASRVPEGSYGSTSGSRHSSSTVRPGQSSYCALAAELSRQLSSSAARPSRSSMGPSSYGASVPASSRRSSSTARPSQVSYGGSRYGGSAAETSRSTREPPSSYSFLGYGTRRMSQHPSEILGYSSRTGDTSSRLDGGSSRAGGSSSRIDGGSSRAGGSSSRIDGGSSRAGGGSRTNGDSSRAGPPPRRTGIVSVQFGGRRGDAPCEPSSSNAGMRSSSRSRSTLYPADSASNAGPRRGNRDGREPREGSYYGSRR